MVVCGSNLHQLGVACRMYAMDNDDKLMPFVWDINVEYFWMESLRSSYGDVDDIRFCPSARRQIEGALGHSKGDATHAWHFRQTSGPDIVDEWGSYAFNCWTLSTGQDSKLPPGTIAADKKNYWSSIGPIYTIDGGSRIPLIMDNAWMHVFPDHTDIPQQEPIDAYDQTVFFDSPMGSMCIDRHDKRINISFVDGSSRKVPIDELWNIKWHPNFEPIGEMMDIPIPPLSSMV